MLWPPNFELPGNTMTLSDNFDNEDFGLVVNKAILTPSFFAKDANEIKLNVSPEPDPTINKSPSFVCGELISPTKLTDNPSLKLLIQSDLYLLRKYV